MKTAEQLHDAMNDHYNALLDTANDRGMAANELALVCMVVVGGFIARNHPPNDWPAAFDEAMQCMRDAAEAQTDAPVSH